MRVSPDWLDTWLAAGSRADDAIRLTLASIDEPFEPGVIAALEGHLPDARDRGRRQLHAGA